MSDIGCFLEKKEFSIRDIETMLSFTARKDIDELFSRAYDIKADTVGRVVYFRGIIEMSNICMKNCRYCGIRHDNTAVKRYMMTEDEILNAARWCHEAGYGSVVIQSGERCDDQFISAITDILQGIRELSDGELGVTLSLGEQTAETYRQWYRAGAHRYLLRIETTNEDLYRSLHPSDHDFAARKECLHILRDEGYQVGTGVMCGLPGQTIADLARDIAFFRDEDIDMIGMGPYIPHKDTPMADALAGFEDRKRDVLDLALKMIAVTRIVLRDVNIAATTALQALDPVGREMGLESGANIVMPNITDTKYRNSYRLYEDKPCTDENSSMCRSCLNRRISSIGESIGYNTWGDSPHFFNRSRTSE